MEEISLENLNLICDYLEANGFEDFSFQHAIIYENENLQICCENGSESFSARHKSDSDSKIEGIRNVEELKNAIDKLSAIKLS